MAAARALASKPEVDRASCDWSTKSLRRRERCEGLIDACGGEAMSYCVGGALNCPLGIMKEVVDPEEVGPEEVGPVIVGVMCRGNWGYEIGGLEAKDNVCDVSTGDVI